MNTKEARRQNRKIKNQKRQQKRVEKNPELPQQQAFSKKILFQVALQKWKDMFYGKKKDNTEGASAETGRTDVAVSESKGRPVRGVRKPRAAAERPPVQ